MINNRYSRAYTEVLEILSHLPSEEYEKIPVSKIDSFRERCDKSYDFHIDPLKDLNEQNISREAYRVIITLYRDYFATRKQKIALKAVLEQNSMKKREEQYRKMLEEEEDSN